MINTRLQKLRDIVYQTPSEDVWTALWDMLDAWPEDEDPQVAVDYVLEHVSSWPEALRHPPEGWTLPLGRTHKDPRIQLLTEPAREAVIAQYIGQNHPESTSMTHMARHLFESREATSRVLWTLYRSGKFVPLEAHYHWDAMIHAGSAVDGDDLMMLLRHFEGTGNAVLPFSSSWMVWDNRLEILFKGIDDDKLQPLVEGWQSLDRRLGVGLGYALARRGALSGDALGADAVLGTARHIVRHQSSGAEWHMERGVWSEEVWGSALVVAITEHTYHHVGYGALKLMLEALPHADHDTQSTLAMTLFDTLIRGNLAELGTLIEVLDTAAEAVEPHLDTFLEPLLTPPTTDNARHTHGRVGKSLAIWRALRGSGLDPRFDRLLDKIPLTSDGHYSLTEEDEVGLGFLVQALMSLPEPRRATVFAAWNQHFLHTAHTNLQLDLITAMSRSGPPGQAALIALLDDIEPGKEDPWRVVWLLQATVAAGGTLKDNHDPALRRAVKNPSHNILAVLATLPTARVEKILLAGGATRWFFIEHIPSPKLIAKAVGTIAAWPRGRHDDEDSARKTLRAAGPAALPALRDALMGESTILRRELLLEALMAIDTPEIAPTLLHLLSDTRKDIRADATRGLVALGEDVVLEGLEGLLGHRKKAIRVAAAEVLVQLPPSATLSALADQHLPTAKDPAVRARLTMLQTAVEPQTTPLDEGRARLDALPKETLDAAEEAFDKGALHEEGIEGPDAVWVLWSVLDRRASRQDIMSWTERNRWRALCQAHARDPNLPWILVDTLSSAVCDCEDLFDGLLDTLSNNPETEKAVCHALLSAVPPRRKPPYRWLTARPSMGVVKVLFRGLSDDFVAVRRWCVHALAQLPSDAHEPAVAMLAQGTSQEKIAAADLFDLAPSQRWLPALDKALGKRASARIKVALTHARLRCLLARVVPMEGLFEDSAHRVDLAIAEALAEAPEPSKPFLEDPPPLALKSGVPLHQSATAWWLGQLALDRIEHSDPLSLALARRLDEDSARQLAEALFDAFVTARTPGRERRWIFHAAALMGSHAAMFRMGLMANAQKQPGSMIVEHTLDIFRRWPIPTALMWLGYWTRFARNYHLKPAALDALRAVAAHQKTSVPVLLDGALDTLDTDTDRARQHWGAHLEAACADQRSWTLSDAKSVFLGTDQRAELSEGLVFALTHSAKRTLVSWDGLAEALQSPGLPAETLVTLPHRLDMDQETLARWQQRIEGSAKPIFEQLGRGVGIDPEPEAAVEALQGPIRGPKLHHALYARGYAPIVKDDMTHSARREVGADLEIVILHTGYAVNEAWVGDNSVAITGARAQRRAEPVSWDTLPDRVPFEVARDILIIAGQHREVDP